MYARVSRFNDVTAERISEVVARIEEEGPPTSVDSTGIQVFVDEAKGTAVFVGYFETEQKMRERGLRRDGSVGDPRHPCLHRPLRAQATTLQFLRAPAGGLRVAAWVAAAVSATAETA
jgi:hypothetical protein